MVQWDCMHSGKQVNLNVAALGMVTLERTMVVSSLFFNIFLDRVNRPFQ